MYTTNGHNTGQGIRRTIMLVLRLYSVTRTPLISEIDDQLTVSNSIENNEVVQEQTISIITENQGSAALRDKRIACMNLEI